MGACSQASETETDTDTDASDTHCASDQASETETEANAAGARTAGGRQVRSTRPTETEPNSSYHSACATYGPRFAKPATCCVPTTRPATCCASARSRATRATRRRHRPRAHGYR